MYDQMTHERRYQAWALWLLRLSLGIIFIGHGGQKVFGLWGGPGLEGFVQWIGTFGVPPVLGYLAAFAELAGGICMFLGVATEVGALLTIPVMIGAVFLVHWPNGYLQHDGFEFTLHLILLAAAVIIGGPGCGALWDPFKKFRK